MFDNRRKTKALAAVLLLAHWFGGQTTAQIVGGGGSGSGGGGGGQFSVVSATYTAGTYYISPGGSFATAVGGTFASAAGQVGAGGSISNFTARMPAASGAGTATFTFVLDPAGGGSPVDKAVTCSMVVASATKCADTNSAHSFNEAIGDFHAIKMVVSGASITSNIVLYWGLPGVIGSAGPVGPTGAASTVPGPTGPTGPVGGTGAQGPAGTNGTNGAVGPTGPTGPAGIQGPTGPAGSGGGGSGASPYESTLFTGPDSSRTITGATHGFATRALLVKVYNNSTPRGTIETGQWTVDPTTFDVVIPFAAPQSNYYVVINGGVGAQGPTGPTGPGGTGPTGPTGPSGPSGATGPTGPTGAPGIGSGTVTQVTLVGTANQITLTGTCTVTSTGTCTFSLPSALQIPGTINKITVTQPATGATITVADGKVLTVNNTLTETAIDGAVVAFGAGGTPVYMIASGTTALGTSSIAANSCATAVTATATGAVSTDHFSYNPSADWSGLTGYGVASTDGLILYPQPITTNTMTVKVCNATSTAIIPSAASIAWWITGTR